jgi:hypothetical protein
MNNVVMFPNPAGPFPKRKSFFAKPQEKGRSMHNFLFRSYDLIVESSEAELLRDVRLDTQG